jgi:glycosyltransferase involved in cell wall biosynthesis
LPISAGGQRHANVIQGKGLSSIHSESDIPATVPPLPLVSIITPCRNGARFLEEMLVSVIEQTFTRWELIVADDHSTDNSAEIVKRHAARDPRIRLVMLREGHAGGAANARNAAIRAARGRFIAFLDCDDLWFPSKLEKQLDFMRENDLSLSYTSYEEIDEQGRTLGEVSAVPNASYTDMLKVNRIGCLTAMYDAEKLGKVFQPIPGPRGEDYATWLRIMEQDDRVAGMAEPLAAYRLRHGSISRNKLRMARNQWRFYREYLQMSRRRAAYFWLHYASLNLLRRLLSRLRN